MEFNIIKTHFKIKEDHGDKCKAICPCHPDKEASLHIKHDNAKGTTILKCFAGCEVKDIVEAVGLKFSDLFDKELKDKGKFNNKNEIIYQYKDASGNVLFEKVRFEATEHKKKHFSQKRIINSSTIWGLEGGTYYETFSGGDNWSKKKRDNASMKDFPPCEPVIYNLPEVTEAIKHGENVYVVEGEKDAENLKKWGLVATCNFDGASTSTQKPKWRKEYNQYFKGAKVIVFNDNDDPGRAHADNIAVQLYEIAEYVKRVEIPDLQGKEDISDWIIAGHNKDELMEIVDNTELYSKPIEFDELEVDINRYDFSDLGIAKRFKDQYKDVIKYSVDTKTYYSWNGKYWEAFDEDLPIRTIFNRFVEAFSIKINDYINYFSQGDEDKIKFLKSIIQKLKSEKILNSVTKRYKTFDDTHIMHSILDKEIIYINCKNGVVDTETGELISHKKELYITKYVDIDYIPGKVNLLYKGAIDRLFKSDKKEIEAFEILLGYMLSGKANQKKFPMICGARDSGKSKIFEIIMLVVGKSYVTTISKELIMKAWNKSAGPNQDLVDLQGVRLVLLSETTDTDYLNADLVKRIVGGDTIKARPLYKPSIEFRPIFIPVIFTNDKPKFDGNDDALASRIISIELLYPLAEKEINKNFEEDCLKDKEGIFSYLIGCIVKFNTLKNLTIYERWKNSSEEYAKNNNIYSNFKELFIDDLKGHSVAMKEIHVKFESWYAETQGKDVPSRKRITMELKKLISITDSSGYTYGRNIALINYTETNKSYVTRVIPFDQ